MPLDSVLNPELARLLDFCNMDRSWQRGEGAWLYDAAGRRFLDCYAQYGAVVLGHNAPGPVAALRAALDELQPAMVQPYRAPNAVALAEHLSALAPPGLTRCVFTTSGAETVEAAIKLVRVATGRSLIVSCDGSFHGKTMGARAVSGRPLDDGLFGPRPPGFARVPFGDAMALAAFLDAHRGEVAAVMVEPVQGERGVFLPPTGYLRAIRALCDQAGAALILDEIQTGLGRTGRLFACEHEGVAPDLLLLAKGLGGGLVPLGACLATEAFWHPAFALGHSSTFANNNIACRIGLAVLDALTNGDACVRAARAGVRLQAGLNALAQRYPNSIAEVRGAGLLTAIELRPAAPDDGFMRSYLQHNGIYAYAVASALAENHSVLALPALSGHNALRVAPNLLISDDEIDFALRGLDGLFTALEAGATDVIARALWRLDHQGEATPAASPPADTSPAAPLYLPRLAIAQRAEEASYAFLIHPTRRNDLLTMDPTLRRLSEPALERLTAAVAQLPPGVVYEAPPLVSATGASARGWLIGLGLLPEEMVRRGRAAVGRQLAEAAGLAEALGARVLGLGAFTSIFSRRGRDLVGICPVVTTGNCLTAAMAFAAIERIAERRGIDLRHASIGVVGARGSVGMLATQLLASVRPKSMILVGDPGAGPDQMRSLRAKLAPYGIGRVIETTDLHRLIECDIVLSATSSRAAVLDGAELRPGVIVCDVARPPDASDALRARRDLTVIDGGLVTLPDPTIRFGPGNIQGFPDGQQLACLAETILLALAGETRDTGIGDDVSLDEVDRVMALAQRHGFSLAEPPLDALDRPALHTATRAAE